MYVKSMQYLQDRQASLESKREMQEITFQPCCCVRRSKRSVSSEKVEDRCRVLGIRAEKKRLKMAQDIQREEKRACTFRP